MAIVKQGSTTLNAGAKGDKGEQGDAGVVQSISAGTNVTVDASDPANPIVSSSGGGGGNSYTVTQLSDITGDQSANANKQWDIIANIDLGTANITLPTGVILNFNGSGRIINGTLTSNDTTLPQHPFKQIFDDTLTLAGDTWNVEAIYPEWFGAKADNNIATDNKDAIQAAFDFARVGAKVVIAGGGNYYVDVIDMAATPTSWGTLQISHSNTFVEFYNDSYIAVTPNIYIQYTLLSVVNCDNVTLYCHNKDGGLKGDFIGAKLATPDEYGHLLVPTFRTTNLVVDGLELADAYGDGIKHRIHNGFITNALPFEQGGINKTTGDTEDDATKIRNSSYYDLTSTLNNPANDRISDYQRNKELHVTGGSYGGLRGIDNGIIDLFFYTNLGAFIECYSDVEMYDRIKFPDNAVRVYIVSNQPNLTYQDKDDITVNVDPVIRADEITLDMVIRNCNIHDSSRNNISITGAARTIIENNILHDAKGTLPRANIDIEDYHDGNKNTTIRGNTMWNGYDYDIVTVSSWNVFIYNNKFLHQKPASHLGTIVTQGRGVVAKDNYIEFGNLFVSDNGLYENNESKYTRYYLADGIIRNERITDGMIVPSNASLTPLSEGDGKKLIENIIFFNTDSKLAKTGFNYSYREEAEINEIVIVKNLKVYGTPDDREDVIRSAKTEVYGFETINSVNVYSPNVNNLKTEDARIWYTPLDNEYVRYDNWELKGLDANIRFRSGASALGHFEFNNLIIETERIAFGSHAIDVDADLGSLVIKNSSIIDRGTASTNWSVINFDTTVSRFRMLNTEVVTATAGNLLAKGTSTEDTTWIYKDCVFDTVILNNTLGIEVSNIINDVYTP